MRTAECRNAEDQAAIRSELEAIGASECNALVVGLMREQLARQARAALAKVPVAERATSVMINQVAVLLEDLGMLEEAEPLKREFVKGCREKLGARHENTLIAVGSLAKLLYEQGKLKEAEPLMSEAAEGMREVNGPRHEHTLIAVGNLAALLQEQGKLKEAEPLYRESLEGKREVLGPRHPRTLTAEQPRGAADGAGQAEGGGAADARGGRGRSRDERAAAPGDAGLGERPRGAAV